MDNYIDYAKFPIRKITKGDLKTGMTYILGARYTKSRQSKMGLELVSIVYDDAYFHKSSEPRYHLFLDDEAEDGWVLWKTLVGDNITIEYDIYAQKD